VGDVLSLAERSHLNAHWNVEQMLEYALETIRSGQLSANRGVVVLLDDESRPEGYDVYMFVSRLEGDRASALLANASLRLQMVMLGILDDGP